MRSTRPFLAQLLQRIVALLVLLIVSFCPLGLLAQNCEDYSDYWHFTGSVWIDNTAAVVVAGNYAYVANADAAEGGGLRVVDISDLAHPVVIGSVETSGTSKGLVVVGDYAYLANNWRMHIVDISTPTDPQLVATFDPPSTGARDVAVWGQYAFLASGSSGIRIISLVDPLDPQQVGQFDTPGMAQNVLANNNRLYIADGSSGLLIYNIRWPSQPKFMGAVDTGTATGVAVGSRFARGSCLYVSDAENGLVIVDVVRPWQPQILNSVPVHGYAEAVAASLRYAYVIDHNIGLQIIDIAGGGSHGITLTVPQYPTFNGLTIRDGTVFLTGGGLTILDPANREQPDPLAVVDLHSSARDLAIKDNFAFVLAGRTNYNLQTVAISDPLDPQINHTLPLALPAGDDATDIAIAGDYGYIAHGNLNYGGGGLLVVDLSPPLDPVIANSIETTDAAQSMHISGNSIYLVDLQNLLVADIADPESPELVATLITPGTAVDVTVSGDFAYIADSEEGLFVADISVTPPVPVTSLAIPGQVLRVSNNGDLVYALSDYHGLFVIDITNPASPEIVGSVDTPGNNPNILFAGLTIAGNFAYVGDARGLQIIDVSNPNDPHLSGTLTTPFATVDLAVAGNNLWLTNSTYTDNGDLRSFWLQCESRQTAVESTPAASCRFDVYPNPFNPRSMLSFVLPHSARVGLELFDMRGLRVRVLLPDSELAAGSHSYTWNGCDDSGRNVASGVYLARLMVDGSEQRMKMVLLR